MKRVIDLMVRIDCPSLIGVVYSTVGRAEAVPPAEKRRQWKTVARNLREVCDYAAEQGRDHRARTDQPFRDRLHQHLRARA